MITAAMKAIGRCVSRRRLPRSTRAESTPGCCRDISRGKECTACRVLVAEGLERCSFCGGELEPVPDLINRASHRVIEQAGKVQMVSGEAAGKLEANGIGAVLRF